MVFGERARELLLSVLLLLWLLDLDWECTQSDALVKCEFVKCESSIGFVDAWRFAQADSE